eukprot:12909692-Prorocentrum_lima.AAC.1
MLWACEIDSNYCIKAGTNLVVSSSNHDDRQFCGTAANLENNINDPFCVVVEAGLHEQTNVLILCDFSNVLWVQAIAS